MRRLLVIVCLSGCSSPATTVTAPTAAPTPTVHVPTPDPKIVAYKTAVAAFTAEARSLCRYLDDGPSQPLYGQKLRAVIDLSTRIPDAPLVDVRAKTKKATGKLEVAEVIVGMIPQFIAHDDKKSAADCLAKCRKIGREVADYLDEIDEAAK